MGALIARRLVALLPILLLVSLGVFALVTVVPGDAAARIAGGADASLEEIEAVRTELGLDDPLLVQYGRWLQGAVRLDLGESYISGRSVTDEIRSRMPITLAIAFGAIAVAVVLGVPAGIVAGTRPGGLVDRACLLGTSLGIAVPNFVVAIVLVTVFAVNLGWFDPTGFVRFSDSPSGWLRSLILPSLALGAWAAASLARQVRAGLIDVLATSYVRTAWAKGARPGRVVGKHALKNAAIPAVTVLGLQLGTLLGGAVIVEQIFSIQGLGIYLVRAIIDFDLPVIQGVTIVFVLTYALINLVVDVAYGWLNPKVRVT
jgi:peptide/nickel transport system permease protein